MLNSRLHKFLEHHNILDVNQAGFSPGYSTTDHIFVLHALIEILKSKKVKLFCSFIDFSKAFDSVWRVGLWTKILKHNIKGNFFRIIYVVSLLMDPSLVSFKAIEEYDKAKTCHLFYSLCF